MAKEVLVKAQIRHGKLVLRRILSPFDEEDVNNLLQEVWVPIETEGIVTEFRCDYKRVRNGSFMMLNIETGEMRYLVKEELNFLKRFG